MANQRVVAGPGLVAMVLVLAWAGAPEARADRIFLRGGGELQGVLVPGVERPGKALVQTEKGAAPVAFDAGQIVKVLRVPGPLDDYFVRRDRVESTAAAEYELGLWCEENGLPGLANLHYGRAVERDKGFAPAHKKLGHTLHDGRWMTSDEMREALGMVKHKGKWITREEKARVDAGAARSAEQGSWARRIRITRQALFSAKPEVRERAERDLLAIRDPAAVAPLARLLGDDLGPIRLLMTEALGAIPGPEATAALVGRALVEIDPDVRQAALDELVRRDEAGVAAPHLLKALRHPDPTIVGRAALALAGLEEVSAVPKLIGALVRVRQQVVLVPTDGAPSGGMGFSSMAPSGIAGGGPALPVITGAVVGPGAIGFGAGSISPYSMSNFSVGTSPPRPPQPRLVRYVERNDGVLEALVRLTGVNFGFDVPSWRQWLASSYRSEPVAARRVPEP